MTNLNVHVYDTFGADLLTSLHIRAHMGRSFQNLLGIHAHWWGAFIFCYEVAVIWKPEIPVPSLLLDNTPNIETTGDTGVEKVPITHNSTSPIL